MHISASVHEEASDRGRTAQHHMYSYHKLINDSTTLCNKRRIRCRKSKCKRKYARSKCVKLHDALQKALLVDP